MDRVIFQDYPPGFSLESCMTLYTSFVETPIVGNSNVPFLHLFELKPTHEHVHRYNIRHLQYVPVNTSYFEPCQLAKVNYEIL